MTNYVLTHY